VKRPLFIIHPVPSESSTRRDNDKTRQKQQGQQPLQPTFRELTMTKQLTLANANDNAADAAPSRFDLRRTGLTDAQLKAIAGARAGYSTTSVTVGGVTRCCWG
jgi:C1A family cysteine protease